MKANMRVSVALLSVILLWSCDTQSISGPESSNIVVQQAGDNSRADSSSLISLGSFTVGIDEQFVIGDLTAEVSEIEIFEPDDSGVCDVLIYSFWYEDDTCGGLVEYRVIGDGSYAGNVYLGESKFRLLQHESGLEENSGLIIRVHALQANQATLDIWSYTGVTYVASSTTQLPYQLYPGDELRLTEGRLMLETIYWNQSAELRYAERSSHNTTNRVSIIKNEFRSDKTFFEPSFEIGDVSVDDLSLTMDFQGSP